MPDVSGMRFDDACIVLSQAGFGAPVKRYVQDYAEDGTVVTQAPMRGQLVDSDVHVELRVARQNWIRFLPQIYQVQGAQENDLFFRFLWIFQQIHDQIGERIDRVHEIFEPLETPPEMLDWLASWLALHLETDWPEEKKRRWLRYAPALFAARGTRKALEQLLELYLDIRPTIYENEWPDGAFRVGVTSEIGVTSTILPPMNLNAVFVVELPMAPNELSDEMLVRVHRVIQSEKPAHANYFLRFHSDSASEDWGPFMTIGEETVGTAEVTTEV